MATRRTSKRKSAPRRPAARGLRARCVVRFDPGRVDLGGIAASMLDDLSDRAGAFVVEVLITERVQRVTYVGGKGKGLTVVYRGREGMDIWDAATRSVATIDPGMIPRSMISPARSTETSINRTGKDTVVTIAAADPGLGAVPAGGGGYSASRAHRRLWRTAAQYHRAAAGRRPWSAPDDAPHDDAGAGGGPEEAKMVPDPISG